jgi:hypothetical protein
MGGASTSQTKTQPQSNKQSNTSARAFDGLNKLEKYDHRITKSVRKTHAVPNNPLAHALSLAGPSYITAHFAGFVVLDKR